MHSCSYSKFAYVCTVHVCHISQGQIRSINSQASKLRSLMSISQTLATSRTVILPDLTLLMHRLCLKTNPLLLSSIHRELVTAFTKTSNKSVILPDLALAKLMYGLFCLNITYCYLPFTESSSGMWQLLTNNAITFE